ncbi:MAG: 4-demethylwyosine synthase TYW1 [Candidatus Diapherotrites archaeon]|nr:4-demethylwyosine synthase TYW1 [Candidatus Diapherotrites archaeon]
MEYADELKKMGYRIVGRHSAVKTCHWCKASLAEGRTCYKQKFYGIQSHRCMQMTPSIYCMQRCLFCWRPYKYEQAMPEEWDEPEDIINGSIDAQRKLLEGYYGNPNADKKKLDEAMNPNQVAISLAGEPTTYPKISELIQAFHKRDFTTFLVTNGLLPEALEKMTMPTQLYVSLDAPNEAAHKRLNVPLWKDSWERLNKTLELLPSLDTRTCIRITLVKGWNDTEPEAYAKLLEKSGADFIEVKAYMLVGASRERLRIENMPRHAEVKAFAESITQHLRGYDVVNESEQSRVVLLTNHAKPALIG